MDKREILKLSSGDLQIMAAELFGWTTVKTARDFVSTSPQMDQTRECGIHNWDERQAKIDVLYPDYPNIIGDAMRDLFESVYGKGGKIKDGAWVLGTVHNGQDCAHACLMWKEKCFTKFRPLKVEVTRPRGEMAKAITQVWVCAMMGVSDE